MSESDTWYKGFKITWSPGEYKYLVFRPDGVVIRRLDHMIGYKVIISRYISNHPEWKNR